ncbi:hypothetical protein AGMMS50268_16680 [Spirochaetia bacterium]|nr:hypothetical protein AGMMS49546_15100 [Spirochaetia bacterium]GHV91165.1 hypothetical protein AGMMS50268_16680 [Spirochaetia bacterium]
MAAESNIRFIGGLWRILDHNAIKSFATYADALAYQQSGRTNGNNPWEALGNLAPSDDIAQQLKV